MSKVDELFPHGVCECDGDKCCRGRGPAAYRVTRNGKEMIVCTRCDLITDTNKVLLVTKDDPIDVYLDFDILGAICLGQQVAESIGK